MAAAGPIFCRPSSCCGRPLDQIYYARRQLTAAVESVPVVPKCFHAPMGTRRAEAKIGVTLANGRLHPKLPMPPSILQPTVAESMHLSWSRKTTSEPNPRHADAEISDFVLVVTFEQSLWTTESRPYRRSNKPIPRGGRSIRYGNGDAALRVQGQRRKA